MGPLHELVASSRERAKRLPRREPASRPRGVNFKDALRGKECLDVIAEFKRRSPSLGAIGEPELEAQVKDYEKAGAAAISVLTEPDHFQGSSEDLALAVLSVAVPVLMKDFVVDPAQVREAAFLGARAVLLIARCLSREELEELVAASAHYGVTPFIECHDAPEIERAMRFEEALLGANNRDLETLEIDRSLAPRLLREVPPHRVVVAESGYERPEQVSGLQGLADAVLIGSALMRHTDPAGLIREIRG